MGGTILMFGALAEHLPHLCPARTQQDDRLCIAGTEVTALWMKSANNRKAIPGGGLLKSRKLRHRWKGNISDQPSRVGAVS